MTPLDSLLPLLVQVPLVGLFMLFILERDKRDRESNSKRDAEWRVWIAARDQEWRSFLERGDDIHREGMARLAEEVKTIAALTSAGNSVLMQHDTTERAVWERMQRELDARRP